MSIKEQLQQPGRGKKITGHDLMDIQRFDDDTRHMIVFDVLTWDCPVGDKGERVRIFLTDEGYKQALESEGRGECKIIRRARVRKGDIFYDAPERDHEEY
jgi:hypothetical protein